MITTKRIQVQRECAYNEYLQIDSSIPDGTYFTIVTCWRKHSRLEDWNIKKSVVKATNQIPISFDEEEASTLPFSRGWITVYQIDSATGLKKYYESIEIDVIEGTAGSGYIPSVSQYSVKIPWSYTQEGIATVGILPGSFTADKDGKIANAQINCQDAPIGGVVTAEMYVNGVATGLTVTLAPGDRENEATFNYPLSTGDVVTTYITEAGGSPTSVRTSVILNYQAIIN